MKRSVFTYDFKHFYNGVLFKEYCSLPFFAPETAKQIVKVKNRISSKTIIRYDEGDVRFVEYIWYGGKYARGERGISVIYNGEIFFTLPIVSWVEVEGKICPVCGQLLKRDTETDYFICNKCGCVNTTLFVGGE